jgi:heat shock protein HslJ
MLTGIYMTEMAGTPEAMEVEQVYFELLGQVKKYTMSDSELKLLDASGNELLTFGISATLADTQWQLVAWSVSSTDPTAYTMTLNFDGDEFSGRAAVNYYFGEYQADDAGHLTLSAIGSTDMAGTPEMMQAENIYFELLGQVKKYTVTASALTLLDENSNELLIFEKA